MKCSSHSALTLLLFSPLVVGVLSFGEMRIWPRVIDPNTVALTFDCATTTYYQILTAGSLQSNEWIVTEMGLDSLSQVSWTSSFPQAVRYFRVRAVPQSTPHDEDGDGLDDVFELSQGLNPLNLSDAADDPDSDGLSNLQEFVFGTSLWAPDTDQDGLSDEEEVAAGLDPLYNPLQHRRTSLTFTYDNQDRLERVESSPASIQMGYDDAGNLTNAVCTKGD